MAGRSHRQAPVDTHSFLPYLLPYLGESGWFSASPGARKPLDTNDLRMWLPRGGETETRNVDGSTPSLATITNGFRSPANTS